MKLYYIPGASSLAAHIVLREAGLPFELDRVSMKTKKTSGGEDFAGINPKGHVPALKLDDATVLTECPVVLQYLADRAPEKKLAPPAGSMERYRLMEWLNYITSELHKGFGVFFTPGATDDCKNLARTELVKRLDFVEQHLGKRDFLLGDDFTVADAYLFSVVGWSKYVNLDLAGWPALKAYHERMAARPAVAAAMQAEGM